MADDIAITIRTRGGRQSAQDARQVATAIGTISPAARRAASAVGSLGRESARAGSRGFSLLRNQAQYAGFAIGGIGALAIRSGLQFNASMEQNQIAFGQFLGSAQAARAELATLYNLAKVTPFEFADLTLATRKFLAFGFTVRQSNAMLKTVADTASGLALDQGGIDRMVLAIGQIRSKGTLQAEDLRQLQELGAVDVAQLGKSLGLTAEEMANIGKEHVPATKALAALKKQWDTTFGGMSAKQAKTFSGQMSTLRDNTNQLLGTITKPGFNRLRKDVLPALNDLAGQLGQTWGGTATTDMKLFASREQIRRALRPLEEEVGQLHLGRRFGEAVDAAAPAIGRAFGRAAPHAVGAFFDAWKASGPWVQLGTVALGALKLASFVARGAAMGRGFRLGWGTGVGMLPTPVGVAGSAGAGRLGTTFGKAFGLAAEAAIAVAIGRGLVDLSDQIGLLGGRRGRENRGKWVDKHIPGMKWLRKEGRKLDLDPEPLPLPRTHTGRPRRTIASPDVPRTRAVRLPTATGSHHVTVVQIDGKTVARAVHRHASDAKASRRGG